MSKKVRCFDSFESKTRMKGKLLDWFTYKRFFRANIASSLGSYSGAVVVSVVDVVVQGTYPIPLGRLFALLAVEPWLTSFSAIVFGS
jgi:hypothetical protein